MIDETLINEMIEVFREAEKPAALLPFNIYSKYIANRFRDDILCIIDKMHIGWKYRGIEITGMDVLPASYFCCSVEFNNELVGMIKSDNHYSKQKIYYFPESDKYKKNKGPFSDIWFYYELKREMEYKGIVSMLDENKLFTLMEMLKASINIKGKVLEYGVWLGGSAFCIAKLLSVLDKDKEFIMIDLFERMDPNSKYAIMCLDEIIEMFSFYKKSKFHEIDFERNTDILNGESFCFIHYDAPYNVKVLQALYNALMPGGIMVIDNFNNTIGNYALFEKWFKENASSVPVFSPGNINQGIFFKNT